MLCMHGVMISTGLAIVYWMESYNMQWTGFKILLDGNLMKQDHLAVS